MWEWTWGPGGGLASAASFGDNLPWDLVRLGIVIGGLVLAFTIGRVYREQRRRREPMDSAQQARFAALMLAILYISPTEAWVMGTPATPRLIVAVIALALSGYGVWGIRCDQRTQPIAKA